MLLNLSQLYTVGGLMELYAQSVYIQQSREQLGQAEQVSQICRNNQITQINNSPQLSSQTRRSTKSCRQQRQPTRRTNEQPNQSASTQCKPLDLSVRSHESTDTKRSRKRHTRQVPLHLPALTSLNQLSHSHLDPLSSVVERETNKQLTCISSSNYPSSPVSSAGSKTSCSISDRNCSSGSSTRSSSAELTISSSSTLSGAKQTHIESQRPTNPLSHIGGSSRSDNNGSKNRGAQIADEPDLLSICAGRRMSGKQISNVANNGSADVAVVASKGKQASGKQKASKSHLCVQCGRAFSRSDMLTRHSRLHSGVKPHQCSICKQVFSRSDHLSTHERTHTGEKPYQCQQCAYSACRRDMITRHMRTHSKAGIRGAANGQRSRRSKLRLFLRQTVYESVRPFDLSDLQRTCKDDQQVSTTQDAQLTESIRFATDKVGDKKSDTDIVDANDMNARQASSGYD